MNTSRGEIGWNDHNYAHNSDEFHIDRARIANKEE